eukprot:12119391-Prorocentrum_lima.AAC.1
MAGEQLVVRCHANAGSEFWNKEGAHLLRDEHIMLTKTAGYDPKANGHAERFVGTMKRRSTSYMIHAGMSLRLWYWAACQAAYMYR